MSQFSDAGDHAGPKPGGSLERLTPPTYNSGGKN